MSQTNHGPSRLFCVFSCQVEKLAGNCLQKVTFEQARFPESLVTCGELSCFSWCLLLKNLHESTCRSNAGNCSIQKCAGEAIRPSQAKPISCSTLAGWKVTKHGGWLSEDPWGMLPQAMDDCQRNSSLVGWLPSKNVTSAILWWQMAGDRLSRCHGHCAQVPSLRFF